MSAAPTCYVQVSADTGHPHVTWALMSHDAVDTRIPAVWWLSATHHGLSAMSAGRALLTCLLFAGVR